MQGGCGTALWSVGDEATPTLRFLLLVGVLAPLLLLPLRLLSGPADKLGCKGADGG